MGGNVILSVNIECVCMHTPVRMSTLVEGFCGYVYVSFVKL